MFVIVIKKLIRVDKLINVEKLDKKVVKKLVKLINCVWAYNLVFR